jgi:predicted CopG family antitoxin
VVASRRKAVWVSEELWERLMKLKIETRARSLEEVIARFLDHAVGSNETAQAVEASANPPSEERSDEPTPIEPNPQPSGLSDDSSPSKKRKWTFCPQCLNMYDFQGKCPYCGVDLIPLDTEENKKLYLKLKQERGGK